MPSVSASQRVRSIVLVELLEEPQLAHERAAGVVRGSRRASGASSRSSSSRSWPSSARSRASVSRVALRGAPPRPPRATPSAASGNRAAWRCSTPSPVSKPLSRRGSAARSTGSRSVRYASFTRAAHCIATRRSASGRRRSGRGAPAPAARGSAAPGATASRPYARGRPNSSKWFLVNSGVIGTKTGRAAPSRGGAPGPGRLDVERFAAAAAVLLVRVVELEALVQALAHEVELGAVEVGEALRIDEDPHAVALEDVVFRRTSSANSSL